MVLATDCTELPRQFSIVNGQHLTRGCLDLNSEFGSIGGQRIDPWRDRLRFGLVRRSRSFLRIAEAGTVQQHLLAFSPRQIGKASAGGRTPESEEPVTIDAREPCENL